MDRMAAAGGYDRVREFLEQGRADHRRVTAEWLAGRLGVPVAECAYMLDVLAAEGIVRRHGGAGAATWYAPVVPRSWVGLRRAAVGLLALLACTAVVATGVLMHHVFYFAIGLALGLMIAFAWLDWELRARG